jgi:hypothetical protein
MDFVELYTVIPVIVCKSFHDVHCLDLAHCIPQFCLDLVHMFKSLSQQNQLKFRANKELRTSLCKTYYVIKSLTNVTSTRLIWNAYFAYVESKLRYGIIFWGREKKSIQIFQLQKKVIRLITGTHKRTTKKGHYINYWNT